MNEIILYIAQLEALYDLVVGGVETDYTKVLSIIEDDTIPQEFKKHISKVEDIKVNDLITEHKLLQKISQQQDYLIKVQEIKIKLLKAVEDKIETYFK